MSFGDVLIEKEEETMRINCGELRRQLAFISNASPVIIVSDDPEVTGLKILDFYPDTMDQNKEWNSCFKIKVESE